ncbi:RNA polymerase sigma factor [Robertkochia solimangrovi]|uniref:RNA polymerase sigma factor n=1 Tax=Robertkochia solimangrovi TaxID=2213046 RepID=UPI00117F83C0|nr:RNA polymerase sigma factor [Robertkochia solimangrovi]TRZ42814.1 RNA polymerase [Robertkochia solimangrovi]
MTNQREQYYLERVKGGDSGAFGYFVDTYQQMAFTIAVRILKDEEEAQDVVQEAFIKAYQKIKEFRETSKFSTWLYKIVYFHSLDRVKMINRRIKHNEAYSEVHPTTTSEDSLSSLEGKDRTFLLEQALQRLTEEQRTLIQLYYYEELSLKEMSEILGTPLDNLKVKLFRTRKALYGILKDHEATVK